MDFETQKGGNPFLMEDITDYSNPTSQLDTGNGAGLSSNPFLSSNDFSIPVSSENPFLSSLTEETVSASPFTTSSTTSSTNPFAQFTTDYSSGHDTSTMDFFGGTSMASSAVETAPTSTSLAYTNIFATTDVNPITSTADDLFGITESAVTSTSTQPQGHQQRMSGGVDLLESAGDFCKETSDILSGSVVVEDSSSRTSTPKGGGPPRRPPPPRPPPSKETKDLILSVTGAMEATSSHLLDRLQATRTPSPTPIRDLHSPSPTPDAPFSDFLGVGGSEMPPAKLPSFPSNPDLNLLGDMEEAPAHRQPPPVPAVPQRPPKPERPGRPQPPKRPPEPQADFMDIFGGEEPAAVSQPAPPPPAPVNTNADILGLFDAPPPSSQPSAMEVTTTMTSASMGADLLLGDDFGAPMKEQPVEPQEMNLLASSPIAEFISEPERQLTPVAATTTATTDISSTPQELFQDMMEASPAPMPVQTAPAVSATMGDEFDAFAAKFESVAKEEPQEMHIVEGDPFDPFAASAATTAMDTSGDVWGAPSEPTEGKQSVGFGAEESFDAFLSMNEPPPVPQSTPARFNREGSKDSDEGHDFAIFIKPKAAEGELTPSPGGAVPTLAPPPKSPIFNNTADTSPRFNPFDKSMEMAASAVPAASEEPALPQGAEVPEGMIQRTDSQETPPTPLFDEDVSQPLEDFPRTIYKGEGWEMQLRQPNKKKITGQRFWKKVFVRLVYQGDNPVLQLFNTKDDKDPFQELPLQACYSVSDIGAQQFDAYGKIFTVKLQYVFYKERPGVRPGQVTKAERITNKLSQFAAYAIQGDYQHCKEFGSDLRKLGLPVEHAPQISQLFKIGSQTYEDMKQFSVCVEEALFRLAAHRDRALNYKTEEVQITAVDELYVEQDAEGHVDKQIARVRLFFLGFLAGMPDVELGVNDLWRQGKEVVGRHDIIPVITEEWIRLENVEFHSCVQLDEYDKTRVIKFKPPDACYIELMRFRVRPPKNRELPLQVKAVMCVTGNKVELKSDILVPGFSSRKLGQIPCEDIMVRFPIPECWIYLFRVEKHFRYGSVKSAHRRTGKVKGIERLLGAVETLEQSLIEVTSGQAKYEHQHRAIVWRMGRLPKEGQGAYTTHSFVCRMGLTSYDQVPEQLAQYCYVEFTMPATQVSHTTVRSVSLSNGAKDDPPEKYVRYLARHEYRIGIEHTQGEGPAAYIAATITNNKPPEPTPVVEEKPEVQDSDSDSSS
ncbi:protein stoned-B [Anabrus simplex]|uniref:protein stoned-B n=1 Tax=Anabrus simplex TaxID=316456 RepID=UPI0035A3B5AA